MSAAFRIDLEAVQSKNGEIENEVEALPALLDDFEHGAVSKEENGGGDGDGIDVDSAESSDRLVSVMRKWRENEALKVMESVRESVDEMKQRAKALAATYAFDLEEDGGGGNEGIKAFLGIFDSLISEWKSAKIKMTKLEEQRKKEALRQRKKEEAQRKLQEKLKRRKMTKMDLEKKNIFKSRETVQREKALKQKLKLTMRAHVRKQTMLKTHFGDVLHDDHDDQHIDADHGQTEMDRDDDLDPRDMDHDDHQHPVPLESRQTMIRKPSKVLFVALQCALAIFTKCSNDDMLSTD